MKYVFDPSTMLYVGWIPDARAVGREDWTDVKPPPPTKGVAYRWTGSAWETIAVPPDPAEVWEGKLMGAITDPVSGIRLKADEHSKTRFTEGLVLLGAGFSAGYITADTPFPIWDADDVVHATTAQEAQGILTRYGLAWAAMWQEFAP